MQAQTQTTQPSVVSKNQTVWRFDPSHTSIEFSIKGFFFFTMRGRFTTLDGTLVLDESDIRQSSVIATIKSDSIDTGGRRRNAYLRSPAFFAADKWPNIHFQSSKVGAGKDRDMVAVTGSLTISGQSGEVVLDVMEIDRSRSPQGEQVIYYLATTELDRFDFGLKYGRGVIGRTVKVTINAQATRPI
jgi:polyisoprenoid-binding protein YceI